MSQASLSLSQSPSQNSPLPEPTESAESTLLASYLTLLDTYTTLRTSLSETLAAAHLSLAKANFHAPAGRRYGADWFDGSARGAAAVRVSVGENVGEGGEEGQRNGNGNGNGNGEGNGTFVLDRRPFSKARRVRKGKVVAAVVEGKDGDGSLGIEKGMEGLGVSSSSSSSSPSSDSSKVGVDKVEGAGEKVDGAVAVMEKARDEDEQEGDDEERILNPLHQFGILVPQALRQAQSQFDAAVEIMVKIVNAERDMGELEIGVRRARKRAAREIGLKV